MLTPTNPAYHETHRTFAVLPSGVPVDVPAEMTDADVRGRRAEVAAMEYLNAIKEIRCNPHTSSTVRNDTPSTAQHRASSAAAAGA